MKNRKPIHDLTRSEKNVLNSVFTVTNSQKLLPEGENFKTPEVRRTSLLLLLVFVNKFDSLVIS